MLAIQAVCALVDVAIIVLASHYPEGDWYEWALQSWLRRSAFLYLVAYVAASALTFSVKIVLIAGAAALAGPARLLRLRAPFRRARRFVPRLHSAERPRAAAPAQRSAGRRSRGVHAEPARSAGHHHRPDRRRDLARPPPCRARGPGRDRAGQSRPLLLAQRRRAAGLRRARPGGRPRPGRRGDVRRRHRLDAAHGGDHAGGGHQPSSAPSIAAWCPSSSATTARSTSSWATG